MLKRIVATFATLLLAAGLSIVAVAAPASAHTPNVNVGCSTLTVQPQSYETQQGNAKPNSIVVTIDGNQVLNTTFGGSLAKQTFTYDGTQTHTWSVVIDAVGGTNNTQYDVNQSGTTSACPFDWNWTYAAPTCDALTVQYPANIPAGQSNDVNVKIKYGPGYGNEITLNFHNNGGTWSGTQVFTYATHPNWPAGIGKYKVVWTQVAGTNYHWTGEVSCGSDPQDATATVTTNPATCDAAESFGSVTAANATYVVTYPTATTYKVTAKATAGHLFANGTDTYVIDGTLAPKSTEGCVTEPKCLPKSAVTYKYLPATNNGEIYVVNPDPTVYSNDLCNPFWVVATSWYYTSDTNIWPQIRNQVNPLPQITSVGTYPYGATVTCGQGDIYASFVAQPQPTETLAGPNNPFTEDFLHEMGFAGPSPTYMNQAVGCNTVIPAEPTVKTITECGTYGSVVATDTDKVDYTVTGNGGVGTYTVTAVAIAPYVLKNYPAGGWSYDLGSFYDCPKVVEPIAPTIVPASECGTYSTVTPVEKQGVVYDVTFDNVTGDYTVVATPAYGYYFANDADQKITFEGNAGKYVECIEEPDATVAYGECVYNEDGTADQRHVSLTFDNTASNKPVYFAIEYFTAWGLDQWVPAGEKVTVDVADIWPAGGGYTVTAGDKSFELTIPACDLPTLPLPITRDEVVSAYDCATEEGGTVTVTTTTYTTNWTFDTEAVEWVKLPEVAGEPVVTHRAMTPEERTQEKCLVTVTDPEASTCLNKSTETDLTSWIRIVLDPNVEYKIDGVVATTEYNEVTPGEHTITADALNGYTLSGGNPDAWTDVHHEWKVTAVDFAIACQPTLTGSTAAGECQADAPWIFYDIALTDPAGIATSNEAHLIMSDGTNTENIDLGLLVEDPANPGRYILSGKTLWPGAAVGPDGVTPTAWPGWEQDGDGNWVETDGNYRWTRSITQVTLSVNPELVVDLSYPAASPDCDTNPPTEPPTLATVTPAFTTTPLTCAAAGSYTLGELTPGTVQWTVNGAKVNVGTYPVTSAQTLTFVASPLDPADGLDADWVQPDPVVFSQGAAPCNLVQLALTGAGNSFGLIWVGLLLGLTGVGFMLMRRRRTATEE